MSHGNESVGTSASACNGVVLKQRARPMLSKEGEGGREIAACITQAYFVFTYRAVVSYNGIYRIHTSNDAFPPLVKNINGLKRQIAC